MASCLDPVGTDDGGHGTHVAGTIGAAANGIGVSGVAPKVTLVELKGGQDSGYFFLDPVVNALTYAGDAGIDVVNMSFYVDPWLYNCTANPADTPDGAGRAAGHHHGHAARLWSTPTGTASPWSARSATTTRTSGAPRTDVSSPDYPPTTAYPRPVDNGSCLDLPVEGPHVIGVSALGPSGTKADYSNYGIEQISVAAPGGCFRDGFGTDSFRTQRQRDPVDVPVEGAAGGGAGRRGRQHPAGRRGLGLQGLHGLRRAAATTPTCRARRWRRRTRPGWRR